MRLEHLAINGITRFTSPVDIDFSAIAPRGLVAIVGENGSGKSTILDSTIAPICLELPSRGDKGLIKYASGKDAYIDEVFSIGAMRYHARLSMDAVTGRTDGLLQREVDGKWVNLNDGKISTFKAAVASRFPAPSVILASAFAAQNRKGSFLTMDRAKRKDLFAELLGLAHYEAMAETCRAEALKLDRRRTELQVLLERLSADVTEDADADLRQLTRTVRAAIKEAEQERDRLAALKDARVITAEAATEARIKAHEAIAERSALVAAHGRVAADAARLEGERDIIQANVDDALRRITERREADTRTKRQALNAIPTDEAVRAAIDVRAAVLADRRDQAVAKLQTTIAAAAKAAAAFVDTVPCGGKPPYDGCLLLAAAGTTNTSVLELEVERLTTAAEADIAEVRAGTDAALQDVFYRRSTLVEDIVAIQTRANEDTVRARDAATKKRTELDARLEALTVTLLSMDASLDASADVHTAYTTAVLADSAARNALDAHLADAAANQAELGRLEFERQNADNLRALYDSRLKEQVQYLTELEPLEQHLVEYEVLAKCFGREGLPVLEIDAAGPAVSDLCNDLLRSCFGSSRFIVELVTQQPKADGKGFKEVFELKVFDTEREGEARDLTDLSGGEQVIVDEALKSAIALFVSQQHASPIETCWRDETTGALDPDNAVRYIEMLRRLQQRGGFHHILFITQNPDVAALADAQIHVDKATGQVTVRHAPFVEAA